VLDLIKFGRVSIIIIKGDLGLGLALERRNMESLEDGMTEKEEVKMCW